MAEEKKQISNKRMAGRWGEDRAEQFLAEQGYLICERNFQCRTGEIDIIGKKDGYLVFIEVKYRSNSRMGMPEEAVTPRKQQQIIRTAKYYMLKNKIPEDTPCRFDVVVILGDGIRVIQDAYQC